MECDATIIEDVVKNIMQDNLSLDNECREGMQPKEKRKRVIVDLTWLSDDEDFPVDYKMESEDEPEIGFEVESPKAGAYHAKCYRMPDTLTRRLLHASKIQTWSFNATGLTPLLNYIANFDTPRKP